MAVFFEDRIEKVESFRLFFFDAGQMAPSYMHFREKCWRLSLSSFVRPSIYDSLHMNLAL